jgi:hypothetical protein
MNNKLRTTPSGMQVQIGRRDSQGLKGTLANVKHHGEGCRYAVQVLSAAAEQFAFKKWIQGHNVHTFVTSDGRKYRFRPLRVGKLSDPDSGYVGLELYQDVDGTRQLLMQVIEPEDVVLCIAMMHHLAKPRHVNKHTQALAETA